MAGISGLCMSAGKSHPHNSASLALAGDQRFRPACAAALGELRKTIGEFFFFDEQSGHLCLAGFLAPWSIALHWGSHCRNFFTEPRVGPSGEDGTDDWRDPEKPKLGERPTSDKDRRTRASGRID